MHNSKMQNSKDFQLNTSLKINELSQKLQPLQCQDGLTDQTIQQSFALQFGQDQYSEAEGNGTSTYRLCQMISSITTRQQGLAPTYYQPPESLLNFDFLLGCTTDFSCQISESIAHEDEDYPEISRREADDFELVASKIQFNDSSKQDSKSPRRPEI